MEQLLRKLISPRAVRRAYGFYGNGKYEAFIDACESRLGEVIDCETKITELEAKNNWLDNGGNCHVRFAGLALRRNESAEIGGTIVWLKRLKTFRGHFWSHLKPKSDAELFAEAKRLFHARNYAGYLALSGYLSKAYSANRVYQRMNAIDKKRA